eukprot:gene17936-19725_t
MWSWVKSFAQRHKRKLISAGFVIGGIYAAGKVVKWKLSELQERQAEEYAKQGKKQFHYDSNQETCIRTFKQLMLVLRDKVQESLDTDEVISFINLKAKKDKVELWEELKIKSFTKAIVSVVSCCILYGFLKVQMNIISGYMFVESIESTEDAKFSDVAALAHGFDTDSSVATIEKDYLSNIKFFFEHGNATLISDIQKCVKDNIGLLSLKENLNHYNLSKLVFSIWDQFKSILRMTPNNMVDNDSTIVSRFATYLLDSADCSKATVYMDDEKYQKIMSETLDVLESDDFNNVIEECIGKCLETMMLNLEEYFQTSIGSAKATDTSTAIEEDEDSRQLHLPLAKLIPILNAQMNQVFKNGQNEYLDELFSNDNLNALSANIYESFSQDA